MTNTDVVKKLIGSISPVGDSSIDAERMANLVEMTELIYELTKEVVVVAGAVTYQEHSVQNMGFYATGFLERLSELIVKKETD